jgi:hypothetical protein
MIKNCDDCYHYNSILDECNYEGPREPGNYDPSKDSCIVWEPNRHVLVAEKMELKHKLEVYEKILELVFIEAESILSCPINYPAFEEFMGDCNCEACKERRHYSECWMKVYLAQARKELTK